MTGIETFGLLLAGLVVVLSAIFVVDVLTEEKSK